MTRELEHSTVWPLGGLPPNSNPSPPPCSDPEECPRGPTDQTTAAANFAFPNLKKKNRKPPSRPDIPLTMGLCYSSFHFIWEECVVFLLLFHSDLFSRARIVFSVVVQLGLQHAGRPRLFLKSFVLWSTSCCLLWLPVCNVDAHSSSLEASWGKPDVDDFFTLYVLKEKCFIPKTEIRFEKMWPIIYPYRNVLMKFNHWLNHESAFKLFLEQLN